MTEEWKWIRGYEGLYQISNLGAIKSFHEDPQGRLKKIRKNSTKKGYHQIVLTNEGIDKSFYIHRLLYQHFLGEIPPGYEVRHLNDLATDNRLENLTIGTRRENVEDARRNGVYPWNKLTAADVWMIKQLLTEKVGQVALAKMFNVTQGMISKIKHQVTWKC